MNFFIILHCCCLVATHPLTLGQFAFTTWIFSRVSAECRVWPLWSFCSAAADDLPLWTIRTLHYHDFSCVEKCSTRWNILSKSKITHLSWPSALFESLSWYLTWILMWAHIFNVTMCTFATENAKHKKTEELLSEDLSCNNHNIRTPWTVFDFRLFPFL